MSHVPPKEPSVTVLIRADLKPILSQLYQLDRTWDVSNQYLGHGQTSRLDGYRQYIDNLYGDRRRDGFFVLNYILLGGLIALVVTIGWVFTS